MRALTISELRFVAGGTDTLDDVVVVAPRKPTMTQEEIEEIKDSIDNGGIGVGGGSGGGGGGGDPISNFIAWLLGDAGNALKSLLQRHGDSATDLARRDEASTFDRSQVQPWSHSNGMQGYIAQDGSIWLDRNNNGQPETHLRWIGNELWQDTNFDGTWDRHVN